MNQEKIGIFLKDLRKEKEMTQEQLAEKMNVNSRTISRWENAKTMPDFDILIELAKLYDVSIEEILNGERTATIMEKQTEETLYNCELPEILQLKDKNSLSRSISTD